MIGLDLDGAIALGEPSPRHVDRTCLLDFLRVAFQEVVSKLMSYSEPLKPFASDVRRIENAGANIGEDYAAAYPANLGRFGFDVNIFAVRNAKWIDWKGCETVFSGLALTTLARPREAKLTHSWSFARRCAIRSIIIWM
jgi:hypothetical protein